MKIMFEPKIEYFEKLNEIKKRYKELWKPKIAPYKIYYWLNIFTPIEENIWSDIRYLGLTFYPQYPVDKYFIDFADPIKKIGIEADGKIHFNQLEKDELRDKKLAKLGWDIIRIQGRQTYKTIKDYFPEEYNKEDYDEKIMEEYENDCSEGILRKLLRNYYSDSRI